MSLKRKILRGYGLVIGLVVIVSIWAVINLYRLGNASDAILQENYRSILAAENMINALERQDSGVLLFLLGFTAEARQQFQANEVDFLQWLSRAKDNITLAEEPQTLTTLEQSYLDYLAVSTRLFETGASAAEAQPGSYYHDTILPKFKQVRQTATQLGQINQAAMLAASDQAQIVAIQAVWSMSVFGVVVAGLGLGLSLLLANILTRPLKAMTRAAGQIAEGDYNVALATKSSDELGQLAQEIMTMSDKLKAFHALNVNRLLAEQQRGEAIIRSLSDGLMVVDHQCQIIALNPMAMQMLNLDSKPVEGRHFFEVIPNQKLYHQLKTTLETGQALQLDESTATLTVERGGQIHYYHFTITPVNTEPDQMSGAVLLLQDVTKLKTLDRLKSEFVITASHELRTPLTGIAMSIGLLAENAQAKLSANEQALLNAAQEDVQRLRALVNDLLDLSKIESGRMEMALESVAMSLLIERASATLAAQATDKGLKLSRHLPDNLPPVKADPNKITWVLTNLIANAIRYTERGRQIEASAKLAGDHVYVSVADEGAGIPLEYQSKIFDKFVQVKNSQSAGGSGLGLAICKEIIKAHGGTIWVNSAPGQGSTFTFTLPVAKPNALPRPNGEKEND
jgi:NtrC-family two-component system sensor histidine kinase KinB